MPYPPARLCFALLLCVLVLAIGRAQGAGGDPDLALGHALAKAVKAPNAGSDDMARRMAALEARYQIAVREVREHRRTGFLAMGIGLVALGGLVITQRQRVRRIRNRAAFQVRLARQQAQAATAVLDAELTERRRIAAELHEGVAQILSAARMNLSGAQDGLAFADSRKAGTFHKAVALLEQGCAEIRAVSHQMMPEVLMRVGLAAALQALAGVADRRLLEVSVYASPISESVPMHTRLWIYRMVQEALNNTLKHARAHHFDIQLSEVAGQLTLSLEDDGCGFDPANAGPGMGLQSLHQRAALLRGRAEVSSQPGKGTHITVILPIHRTTAAL